MDTNIYGIEETKELFRSVKAVKDAVQISQADNGKIDFPQDLGNFFPLLTTLPSGIGGANKIPRELSDLTEAEIEELTQEFGNIVTDERWQRAFKGLTVAGDAILEIINDEAKEPVAA